MRRAEFLIIVVGYPKLSKFGMPSSPHKRHRWPVHPEGVVEPHKHTGNGDSGDKPAGKKSKSKRMRTGPPGSPRGICIELAHPGQCRCGKYQKGFHAKKSDSGLNAPKEKKS